MTSLVAIIIGAITLVLAFYGLNYAFTRPKSRYTKGIIAVNTYTLLVSSASITLSLAKLGEPQACWLVVDLLGVAIDACTP